MSGRYLLITTTYYMDSDLEAPPFNRCKHYADLGPALAAFEDELLSVAPSDADGKPLPSVQWHRRGEDRSLLRSFWFYLPGEALGYIDLIDLEVTL